MPRILIAGAAEQISELTGFVQPLAGAFEIHAALVGPAPQGGLDLGVPRIYLAEGADPSRSEDVTSSLWEVLRRESYEYVVLTATRVNKEAASRLAQRIGAPAVTEAISAQLEDGRPVFVRNIMAGKALSREAITPPGVVLAAPGRHKPARLWSGSPQIERISVHIARTVEVLERRPKQGGGVRLEDAEIIVSVGRGFRSKEDLKLAFDLAGLIGAQVGCSRPIAADLKWLSEDHWVGLSGKKVRPKLYIALGISGQPQHLAGIMDARIIVAVNKDPNAPIFKYADYGIVGDLYEFVQKLISRIGGK